MTSGSGPAPSSSGPEWWDDGDEDSSGLVEVLTMPQEIADELAPRYRPGQRTSLSR
jgi:hypothetical protein